MEISPWERLDETEVVSHPVYRVTFWELPPRPAGMSNRYPMAFNAEHWRVTNARDALEVMAWADTQGRLYEMFVEVAGATGFTGTVLRLAGFNPTAALGEDPANYLSQEGTLEKVRATLELSQQG
ncbi:hypothetical protein JVX92_15030 (plasmid) [Microbacterium hominis]|uniref:hypothetical protein n=1 Tax=Microbacterium hominis TaxID=162426 RepID=UPI00196298AB|nr:hypothetical protein [Microbacterium hominis]QRY42349.1 hypothetical protein JVX92_15030 [Microbacterium hominis]